MHSPCTHARGCLTKDPSVQTQGLCPMVSLSSLGLHHADAITDLAWGCLAASLKQLRDLSITHAYQMSDLGLHSLGQLPKLQHCFVSGSPLVTPTGIHGLAAHVDQLEFRACQMCY